MSRTLPDSCIRGPEISDPRAISSEIGAADPAALAVYQHGADLLMSARALLDQHARLAELRQTRAFLLGQLRTLEQQHPAAFVRALRAYDGAARTEAPVRSRLASREYARHQISGVKPNLECDTRRTLLQIVASPERQTTASTSGTFWFIPADQLFLIY